ncbi:hypothetical protein ADU90_04780 [Clostridium botulinum]|uniref:Uncharacterized protein n=3 Tax=Clostridium botulinum TaxID=1491 RepID=A0A0A0IMT0_CLOBO|nr:hypothetical protein [Clostridium botulinum]KEI07085.1 hypothetical protein Z952_02285 [Clostridium botulinum C/D str. BKT75002]KEI12162.1 hypothetical protein Z954_06430 [Clostridium botulinum C/D str. BKT2873]KGM96847.1 hypothetical protein Z956_02140 [Clostridium botulinum D str. CCUG 7971]KGN01939.1 hypothetical protein Z955_00635 [Clostridium botulinum C/D str. DC5]KOC48576.1 hypothetical protein ADU88_08170 [Clostridium botulinum]
MRYRLDRKNLDVKCIYDTNKYLVQSNHEDEFILLLQENYFSQEELDIFFKNTLKEVINDYKAIDILKRLHDEGLYLLVAIKNISSQISYGKKCYCIYNNGEMIFLDGFGNQIIFKNQEDYKIYYTVVIKRIENIVKYPTLEEYIEELKNVKIMRKFRHHVKVKYNIEYYLYFGKEVRVCDKQDNIINLNSYELSAEIEDVELESK